MSHAARYAAALLLASWACAPPAGAVLYSFRNVADQAGPFTNFGGAPVINNDGDVAFEATLDDGTSGIFSGPDPATDTIADDAGVFDFPIDLPSINAEGTVAFRAWLDPDDEHIFGLRGIFDGDDPDFDTVADEDDSRFAAGVNSPSIADDGKIAFDAIDALGGFAIYTADDAGIDLVVDDGGPLETMFASSINDSGTTVAFFAQIDAGGAGIFTGDDLPDDLVADASGPYFEFGIPAVNDDDTVIFLATLDAGNGAEGIFSGPNATADRIAGTGGPYAEFSGYSINDAGTVVFGATLDAGGLGIFTGTDPVAHKVIRTGDPLFGSTVDFVSLSRENLNDNGEVAFLYELANGRFGVAIAAPNELERPIGAGDGYDDVRLTSAAGAGTVARLRDGVAADERTLALAFAAGGPLSDALTLAGTADDQVVLELAYEGAAGDESAFQLYERAPGGGPWQPAVLRNTPSGGAFFPNTSFDEYRTGLGGPPALGAHGNDPETDTVWAVLDHDGVFAVPEPAAPGGGAAAALALGSIARRRARGAHAGRALRPSVRAAGRSAA